jgi:iron complex outermembrane receptor protein
MKRLLILFLFLNNFLWGEELVKGRIYDAETNKPLERANVFAPQFNLGDITDAEGKFALKLPSGEDVKLIVSFLGYQKQAFSSSYFRGEEKTVYLKPEIIPSQTVLVTGLIGRGDISPATYSAIKKKDIDNNYIYQDIPEYLSKLPSATFYSENGNGIGYNYLSIRGFDQRRISVSINGIPQNEPEDHNVYWLDFPDLLSSSEYIQVQRGSGSGIVGFPAVGGAINIITTSFTQKPSLNVSGGYGAYNTRKYAVNFSSGLINEKYSITAKLSKIQSSGYRKNSWADYNSYYVSGARFDGKLITQLNFYGGPVSDGLAYNGLPKFAIKNKELRKENYSYWEAGNNQITYKTDRRNDEIENFSQPHFELLNEYKLNDNITINSALFMVLGEGFFDYDGSWADTNYFRLTSGNGYAPDGNPGNALIRAQVENRQYGWMPKVNIDHKNGALILGGEARVHRSLHWGGINYADNLPAGVTKEFRYYEYKGGKDVFSLFANETYKLTDKISLLAEGHLAYYKYMIYDEKYLDNEFAIDDIFFNPKLGVSYKPDEQNKFYLTGARVTREPRLKNYYDAAESSGGSAPQFEKKENGEYNFNSPLVKPETMNDLELGYEFRKKDFNITLNLFYMLFENEIVKNGMLDRFGQPMTGNMDQTAHMGAELSGAVAILNNLQINANITLSRNYIQDGYAYLTDANDSVHSIDLSGNRISGFPDLLANCSLTYNADGFYANLSLLYNGGFYSDNYDDNLKSYLNLVDYSDNKVDAFFTANFLTSYKMNLNSFIDNIRIYFQANNIFNNLYASYAIGKEFFPAAERNIYLGAELGL